MFNFAKTYHLSFMAGIIFLMAGCSTTQPNRYTDITSSSQLQSNQKDDSDHIPYQYSVPVDWRKYTNVIVEPVKIYSGKDNQFEDISGNERQELAQYMEHKFSNSLVPRYRTVNTIQPNTLKIQLTLTGAVTTTTFIGTFTKFDLGGGPYNIVQSIRGKEGLFNGSVMYAVEIYDASSNQLLHAYVAKQYPNAMNVSASIGALSAAKVGIDKGAEEFRKLIN